jgi:type II secretory pathway pseudopilin PulG
MTLLEMLVSLVIMGFVAALLSQALWQLSRTERLLQSGQLRSLNESLRIEWLRAALEALQPLPVTHAQAVHGGERELAGLSLAAPQWPLAGTRPIRLRLVYAPDADTTALMLAVADEPPQPLLVWPGRSGRFRYLDRQGRWHDEWPARTLAPAAVRLPAAVAIQTGLERAPLIVAAPLASPEGQPTRAEILGL